MRGDSPVKLRVREWLLLVGFCVFLFFYGLGQFGLVGADEPRYAQVAREMLARHDWTTPTLNGTPWLEKPPLYYWQAMIAFAIFGVRDWVARIPSAIDASLVVLAVYCFLKKLRPGFHLDGALMTASAAGLVGFAHSASTDMPLAAMFSLAMLCWYAWWETSTQKLLYGFYFFLALAVLAKGPIGVLLAGVVIVLFALAVGKAQSILKTLWLPGVLVFLAVAAPWYIAVQLRNPEFFRVFILEHNLARFGSDLYHHTQPFWFYLPVVALALVPWVAFVTAGMAEVVRAWWAERRALLETGDALNVFLILWLVIPVVFFSLSRSKLPGYILPAVPAGPLLVAEYVRRHIDEDRRPLWLLMAHALISAALIVPAVAIGYIVVEHRLPWSTLTMVAGAIALVVAIGITVTLTGKLGLHGLYFVTLIPVVLAVAALLKIGAPVVDETLSARPVARQLASMELKPLTVAALSVARETEYGLTFYRNQPISRYELKQVPAEQHLLLIPQGARVAIPQFVGSRRVSYLGDFPPQHLEFYWVAGANTNSGAQPMEPMR
ncbi:MAG TPA: glycosyltransferase family 39 protein [Terriglobales bacterium]|nr:glycosyltransferase family 39 protein [Terriglobales bacterium]